MLMLQPLLSSCDDSQTARGMVELEILADDEMSAIEEAIEEAIRSRAAHPTVELDMLEDDEMLAIEKALKDAHPALDGMVEMEIVDDDECVAIENALQAANATFTSNASHCQSSLTTEQRLRIAQNRETALQRRQASGATGACMCTHINARVYSIANFTFSKSRDTDLETEIQN